MEPMANSTINQFTITSSCSEDTSRSHMTQCWLVVVCLVVLSVSSVSSHLPALLLSSVMTRQSANDELLLVVVLSTAVVWFVALEL